MLPVRTITNNHIFVVDDDTSIITSVISCISVRFPPTHVETRDNWHPHVIHPHTCNCTFEDTFSQPYILPHTCNSTFEDTFSQPAQWHTVTCTHVALSCHPHPLADTHTCVIAPRRKRAVGNALSRPGAGQAGRKGFHRGPTARLRLCDSRHKRPRVQGLTKGAMWATFGVSSDHRTRSPQLQFEQSAMSHAFLLVQISVTLRAAQCTSEDHNSDMERTHRWHFLPL